MFTISAKPGTDIWRKPPRANIFNAPSKTHSLKPLPLFKSALATFSAPWTQQYDQAGLLFTFRPSSATSSTSATSATPSSSSSASIPPRWIKTGQEFYLGTPNLSTVSCTSSADWSIAPLPTSPSSSSSSSTSPTQITILAQRETDPHGTSLWIYYIPPTSTSTSTSTSTPDNKQKIPLREICWVYEDQDGGQAWDLEVGAFAARPEAGAEGNLEVVFHELVVEWEE